MILSLDTKNHTAMMISIPRDTWVPIPGMGHQKINAANTVSDFSQSGYPQGGMGQLEQVISKNMGIPINYYALINYTAFKDAVNAVGGINVNIQSPDPRGLFDPNIERHDGGPLKMPNGNNNLNGQQALNLARARGDSYYSYGFPQSDFNRTEHQRQMLLALGVKAKTAGVIANPIKINKLFEAIGKNVKTDLSFANVLRINQLTKDMDLGHIKSLTIANDGATPLLTNYTAADGQAALAPVAGLDSFNRIQQYYQQLTSNNPVVKEGPTAVVLNGGNTTGLAHATELKLQSKGYNVLGIATAGHTYQKTMIIDLSHGKMPNSLAALKKMAPSDTPVVSSVTTGQSAEANGYTADFVIVLGQHGPSN
jgi:LCP family protein required for cell wall assembly